MNQTNKIESIESTEPLKLMPSAFSSSTENSESILKLDQLGPLVVNRDGTLARIENWETLTELEKQNIKRVLVKRNQQRLEILKKLEEEKNVEKLDSEN